MKQGDELLQELYAELRKLASGYLGKERPGHTLQPTALVNEAYMRLVRGEADGGGRWNDRGHFFAAASRAMKRILIDHARRKKAEKRFQESDRVYVTITLPDRSDGRILSIDELLTLDRALTKLASEFPRPGEIVHLSLFAGLKPPEIAEVLELGVRSVQRDLKFATAWLEDEMSEEE